MLALACLGACASACLPRGAPPAGRQIVADRTSRLVGVLPASPDGTLRAVVQRPSADASDAGYLSFDLYLVSAPADGSAPSELLLAKNGQEAFACRPGPSSAYGVCLPTDARGRLVLTVVEDPTSANSTDFVRIDLTTGERVDLGVGQQLALSPSGQRLLITTFDGTAAGTYATLYEADDHAVTITGGYSAMFVGEALFYLTPDLRLMRMLPDAGPEQVRADVNGFSVEPTDAGPQLILSIHTGDPMLMTTAVVDPVTLAETFAPFPAGTFLQLSSDGHWMLVGRYQDDGTLGFALIEKGTGNEEDFETPASALFPQWRPGRAEVWLPVSQYGYDPVTWVKRPGEPLGTLPLVAGGWNGTIFTDDGVYFYAGAPSSAPGRRTIVVGAPDDPTGPLFPLNADGSDLLEPIELPDARFLIQSFYTGPERSDVSVVDPRAGTSHLLGNAGGVIAIGSRRILAMLRRMEGAGDLAVLDLDGGGSTTIATEFAVGALTEPQGADPLGPGARVVYQFLARFASPFDGIWVATVP